MNKQQSTLYNSAFFRNLESESLQSAKQIVPLMIEWLAPRSVVDVGCGVGTWLSVFRELGVEHILGVDGDYVDRKMLLIPLDSFLSFDLTLPLRVPGRFDLVISAEVAEHLPPHCANAFVQSLVSLGDVILFSAAAPKQGWDNGLHLNEQWPDYWAELFRRSGYDVIDCIRRKLWTNDRVCWWYAQNMLLFVKREHFEKYAHLRDVNADHTIPLPIVHPRFLSQYADFDGMSLQRKLWLIRRTLKSIIPGITRSFVRTVRRRRLAGQSFSRMQ